MSGETEVTLKNVRGSFLKLWHAEEFRKGDGRPRYDATVLVEPGSENDKLVKAAMRAAIEKQFGEKADLMWKQFEHDSNKNCYMSGDLKEYEGYAGMMALSSHRQEKDGPPLVISNRRVNPADPKSPLAQLTEKDGKPYSGSYINIKVNFYAQKGDKAGIRCGFSTVQFWKDGDAFTGAQRPTADEFDAADGAEDQDMM